MLDLSLTIHCIVLFSKTYSRTQIIVFKETCGRQIPSQNPLREYALQGAVPRSAEAVDA